MAEDVAEQLAACRREWEEERREADEQLIRLGDAEVRWRERAFRLERELERLRADG